MIKEIKKITNKALDLSNLDAYNISIQLSLDGFSFCINHNQDNELVHFANFEFDPKPNTPEDLLKCVKKVFDEQALLHANFMNVTVTHCNNLVSHVPESLFDERYLKDYLKYTIKLLENDYISYDKITNSQVVSVYLPFVNVNNFLLDIYNSFIYKPASTVLIDRLTQQYKNKEGNYCFVNVVGPTFEVMVLKSGKFELYNHFGFITSEDFLYYILFTAEQLELNPESFKLVLMGEIEKDSELYKDCYNYIRNIAFYKPLVQHPLLNEHSAHQDFTVLNQS